jgi:hypothetical protein
MHQRHHDGLAIFNQAAVLLYLILYDDDAFHPKQMHNFDYCINL